MSAKGEFAVGVDIGGSHIACCAVKPGEGRILDGSIVNAAVDSKAGKRHILAAWSEAIRTVIEEQPDRSPVGIGFAMPGPFDYRTGIANFAGNEKFESLCGVHVAEELAAILGPSLDLRFINDATAFAVGTAWRGGGRDYARIIAVTLGTGFGSAFIDDGIPVVAGNDVPEHGCLWHLPFREHIADDYISTRWFENRYRKVTGEAIAGVEAIAGDAAGRRAVRDIFEDFGVNLGEVLAPWVTAFDAGALIIGGNIANAYELFATALGETLNKHAANPAVAVCPIRDTAALLGAARLFEDAFWDSIKHDLPRK